MKKLIIVCSVWAAAIAVHADTHALADPSAWARDKSALTFAAQANGTLELRHTRKDSDWAIQGKDLIAVKAGDVIRMSCTSRALDGVTEAEQKYSLSVVLNDKKGNVINWTYGSHSAKPGEPIVAEMMIPHGGASVRPRVTGYGVVGVAVENLKIETLGNRMPNADSLPKELKAETDTLAVSVAGDSAAITMTDKRTGRVWTPEIKGAQLVTDMWKAGRAIVVKFVNPQTMKEWTALVSPVPNKPEVLVTVESDGDMKQDLAYPPAFQTKPGERLIVPMNEGISYPVTDNAGIPGRLATFSGHGVCMSFFGVQDDATGAGYMGIIETTDDAFVKFNHIEGSRKTVTVGTQWTDQKGKVGYARRVRFVFLDKGGYVAMCKRYRAYAKEKGKLKTFKEKAKERPLVDRLLGAPNIWCWEWDKIGMVKRLKEAGIERVLWSGGGDDHQVAELGKTDNVLISRYDVYRDIYHPEQLAKIGRKSGSNMDAWPDGAAWDSEDPKDWRKAWPVKAKDGSWTYCACMCDAVSAKFCRKHVAEELKHRPYNTRFIDVTTAAGWDTCYNPAHPMTRGQSRAYRMDLLRLLCDDFGLVVGSETGHDEAVPYCDFFEGMLSLGNYRVPDSGRYLQQIWTNPPPNVVKFQVGAEYRLPLWELVYHDCLCAHWYWGDYNNKLPTLWDKRDLFNVLYGTMGMYMFSKKQWEEDKDRFVKSYKITSPVARKTGYSEMLDHQILSADRMVQRSVFADGTVVTVNFGDKPFVLPEGGEIAGGGHIVK